MKNNALRYVVSAAISLVAVSAVVMSSGCSSGSDSTPTPSTPKTTYTGTIYMASQQGGHIAVVPVTIDPSNTTAPITIGTLDKIMLSGNPYTTDHIFHDVRLDGTKLYYSTIMVGGSGNTHVGYVDLNDRTIHDATIDYVTNNTMVYCASGQTTNYFLPMTMSSPAYIDVIKKSAVYSGATLDSTDGSGNVKRILVDAFRDPNYTYAHGVNSPDGTKLYVAVNESSSPGGALTGTFTAYLVRMSDLVDPNVVVSTTAVTASKSITVGANTVAFRSTFTPDGSKILQAGADRLVVLDGSDLHEVINDTNLGGSYAANGGFENHDVMPTPDGKYAILSVRFKYPTGAGKQDSGLQLYDLTNKKTIGDPVSACNKCHNQSDPALVGTDRQTCGLDGKLTTVTQ